MLVLINTTSTRVLTKEVFETETIPEKVDQFNSFVIKTHLSTPTASFLVLANVGLMDKIVCLVGWLVS